MTPAYPFMADESSELVRVSQLLEEERGKRREVELQVSAAKRRLRAYADALSRRTEEERRRIARELHDQIGQSMTILRITLESLRLAPGENLPARRLQDCLSITNQALEQIRTIASELRPPQLDDIGLCAALRAELKRTETSGKLKTAIVAHPDPIELPPDLETAFFRVAQEALTNVLRHAQASKVRIHIARSELEVRMVIEDNGVGLQPPTDTLSRKVTLGIIGMEERLGAVDGLLQMGNRESGGVRVIATAPLVVPAARRSA